MLLPLRRYVKAVKVAYRESVSGRSQPCRIMPDGNGHVLFRVWAGRDGGGVQPAPQTTSLRVVGVRSIYKDIDLAGRHLTLVVSFRPGMARLFVGVPAHELTDRAVDLDDLWGDAGADLCDRLAHAATIEELVRWMQEALLRQRARLERTPDAAVHDAVRRLQETQGRLQVRVLADAYGLSTRQLRTRFQREVGMSPKRFARIVRVRHVIDRAKGAPTSVWAAQALDAGFYDQAHLIRDFQRLLGETPRQFLRRLRPASDSYKTA